ncbi:MULTISPECIES: hypothetical protein [unclassified Vibrio]|uniref:hypothetical protein n=1 Tax=unclassified Vibrio TaxID=2614977 RepID=UPI0035523403
MRNKQSKEALLAGGIEYVANEFDTELSSSEKDEIRKHIDRYTVGCYEDYLDPLVIDVREKFEYETESDFNETALEDWAEQCGHCGVSGTTKRAYEIGDYYYTSDAITEWVFELHDRGSLKDLCLAFLLSNLPEMD